MKAFLLYILEEEKNQLAIFISQVCKKINLLLSTKTILHFGIRNKILDKIKTIKHKGIHVPGPFTISKLGLILNIKGIEYKIAMRVVNTDVK